MVYFCIPNVLLAGHAPISGHLSLAPPVAAYENHSRERPAPVTDIIFASRGCPLRKGFHCSSFELSATAYTQLEEYSSGFLALKQCSNTVEMTN